MTEKRRSRKRKERNEDPRDAMQK